MMKSVWVDGYLRKCCFRLMAHFPSVREILFGPQSKWGWLVYLVGNRWDNDHCYDIGVQSTCPYWHFFSVGQLPHTLPDTVDSEQTMDLPKAHLSICRLAEKFGSLLLVDHLSLTLNLVNISKCVYFPFWFSLKIVPMRFWLYQVWWHNDTFVIVLTQLDMRLSIILCSLLYVVPLYQIK